MYNTVGSFVSTHKKCKLRHIKTPLRLLLPFLSGEMVVWESIHSKGDLGHTVAHTRSPVESAFEVH
jgi:hypothetical protein